MTTNPPPTKRQMRWYSPPYKPSRDQARKDVEDYLRRRGMMPAERSCDDGASLKRIDMGGVNSNDA